MAAKRHLLSIIAFKLFNNYRSSINPPYKRNDYLVILGTIIILVAIPLTVIVATQNVRGLLSRAAILSLPDLDVTYIERTPRFSRYQVCYSPSAYNPFICGGQSDGDQRWPERGDIVTFTAHLKNHGGLPSSSTSFIWYIDDVQVKSGMVPILSPEEEFTDTFQWVWDHDVVNGRLLGEHRVKFVVDPQNTLSEITKNNNTREDYTNALSFRFHVEQSLYDYFRTKQNAVGSYSFEDYAQYQIWFFQNMFQEAVSSVAPDGIEERLRIDEIVIEPDGTLPLGGTHAPADFDWDGRWGFRATDIGYYEARPEIVSGPGPDGGLIHELGHQIGLIDGYNLDIQGREVDIVDENGDPIAGTEIMPFAIFDIVHHGGCDDSFPDCPLRGIMDAGPGQFTPHNAGALHANKGYRRGYFGDFLMDLPQTNKLLITDKFGAPLSNASIEIYQQQNNRIPDEIVYSGVTDNNGFWTFPTKPVQSLTTATGHVQTDNPFGSINVIGISSVFAIKISTEQNTEFHWVDIFDFNVEYWKGNESSATYTINTGLSINDTTPPNVSLTNPTEGSTVSDNVNVTASATDNVGVIKIEFYVGGVLFGSDTTSPYSFSWDTTTVSNGSHTLSAKAFDAAGNVGTSATVTVTVDNGSSGNPADINDDGFVDVTDLSILLSNWNTSDATADINNDGEVNIFDLSILLSNWTG